MKRFVLIAVFIAVSIANAQAQRAAIKPESSAYYLKLLSSSKDSLYQQVLNGYVQYLKEHPDDYQVMMEQCKVIEKAFYDSYEEYNPNQEAFDQCLKVLTVGFPNQLEVILYHAEQNWGDTVISMMDEALVLWAEDDLNMDDNLLWKVNQKLAQQHNYNDSHFKVVRHGERAMEFNDTLDLSQIVAQAHLALGNEEEALDVLITYKEASDKAWVLSEKGKLLMQLNEPELALELFEKALKDTANSWFDKTPLAKALVENGKAEEARGLFVEEAAGDYAGFQSKLDLFLFDLEHSPADSLAKSYDQLVNESFWHDPAGKFRLQMFWRAPGLAWSFTDVLRILFLLLLFALCLLIPYLWVLPIFALGVRLKNKGRLYESSHERWRLKQFWTLSALLLFAEILSLWLFGYQDWVLENNSSYFVQTESTSTVDMANYGLFFFATLLCFTLFYIRIDDYRNFWGSKWGIAKSIFTGLGIAFALRFVLGVVTAIIRLVTGPGSLTRLVNEASVFDPGFLSVVETIQAINSNYHPMLGFLFVVVLVPFYEEFIFRGVFLSAMQRHIGFFWANVIQACMFALIHDNLNLFLFYLAFGMAAGYLRRNSGSLAASITMHMINNLIAFLGMLML